MTGLFETGTYRAKNGDLVHLREDGTGHFAVEVEHQDGSRARSDVAALNDAVRLSDDPDWPAGSARFEGILRFD